MTESESAEKATAAARAHKWHYRGGLSIQSKLLIMLLCVCLVSSVIVGVIGFINGRQSLHAAAIEQLTTIREMRAAEMTTAIESVKRDAFMNSRNLSAQDMSKSINGAYDKLNKDKISTAESNRLQDYYSQTFIPRLEERAGEEYSDGAFIPESSAG